ncbi:MAG: DUF3040 domain-containing protein [Jatrophihabitantaceae bacterium]
MARTATATKEGKVPLSEHEQRLLDEIEQALYADDPKFASTVRSVRARSHVRRGLILCVLGVLLGLGFVLVGLVSNIIALSVVGFVLVVGACGFAVQTLRPHSNVSVAAVTEAGQKSKTPRPTGLRTRMEERLRRRFDEN